MHKVFKLILVILLLGIMISCDGESNLTIQSTTSEVQTNDPINTTELATETPTTEENSSSTDELTTVEPTTEVSTTTQDTNEVPTTTEVPTTALVTTEVPTTTEIPTTTQDTTEAPTATEVPTTTEAPTTTEPTTIKYVTIYFESSIGSSGILSSSGIAGNPFEMPDDPTKNFYVFDGWFLDESYETPFSITEYPDEDITVYAKWIRMTQISFDELTVLLYGVPGDRITMPNNPTKNGFIFDGWYLDQAYTTPFIQTDFPESDILLYSKWIEEVTIIDEMVQILEDNFNFVCSNNVCVLEESSYMTYTFNLNNVTFTKELLDDDTSGDEQTKTETVVINDSWYVEYNISIRYLSSNTATMRVTGNGLTGSYTKRSFSSNYLSESEMYDDAIQFIDGPYGAGAVGFLKYILEFAEITMADLSN